MSVGGMALAALALMLPAWLSSGPTALAAAPAPDGLSAADWSSIRAAYEANRHAAVAVDGGHLARNPGQRWNIHFDGRAFDATPDGGGWSWGLELVSYGRAGWESAVDAPARVDAVGGRISYAWDAALTEWYVNDSRGVEHGYTVHQRPAVEWSDGLGRDQGEGLRFTLAVRGGLSPRVSDDGRDVTFVDAAGASVVDYRGLTVFDADGVALPASFRTVAAITTAAGAMAGSHASDSLVLRVDDRGARYPLTIDPIAQQAYFKASNTDAGDSFGAAVAVSGDTVVVGAYEEDSSATGVNGNQANNSLEDSGAAFVFIRSGVGWSQQAYLKASNTGAADQFGRAVAMSGDTVVVGAFSEASNATGVNGNQANESASGAGAAYVFVRSGALWSQQGYLKASNTGVGDSFGWSVAVSGDTVVVGALDESSSASGVNGDQADNLASDSGAAYVFVRSGATWTQQAYLKASNTGANDSFGLAVAVSGGTVVVGASSEDGNATGVNGAQASNGAAGAGAAYLFFIPPSLDCNGNGIPDELELEGNDCNGNGVPDDCEPGVPCCPGDLNGDGVVDGADLGILLSAWGLCGP